MILLFFKQSKEMFSFAFHAKRVRKSEEKKNGSESLLFPKFNKLYLLGWKDSFSFYIKIINSMPG